MLSMIPKVELTKWRTRVKYVRRMRTTEKLLKGSIMQNCDLNGLATEHVRSLITQATPDKALSTLYLAFSGRTAIAVAATNYSNLHNDCHADNHIDEDDFASALSDAVNDECERQLSLLEVADHYEVPKRSLLDNADWLDYACDIWETLEQERIAMFERGEIDGDVTQHEVA